jgi:hypothetical protein
LMEACLRAVPEFVERRSQDDPARGWPRMKRRVERAKVPACGAAKAHGWQGHRGGRRRAWPDGIGTPRLAREGGA